MSRFTTRCSTYHQLVGDLGEDHAEGEQVQTGVVFKEVAGRLLENNEGQREDESDVQAWSQNTGVLHREKLTIKLFFLPTHEQIF